MGSHRGWRMSNYAKERRTGCCNGCVLVVDDDGGTVDEACELLNSAGYRAYGEADPDAVVDRLKTDRSVGLVFSDVSMPTIGGVELATRIKNDRELQPIPVILLSGVSTRDTVIEAMRVGVSDFLIKPLDPESLLEAANRHLRSVPQQGCGNYGSNPSNGVSPKRPDNRLSGTGAYRSPELGWHTIERQAVQDLFGNGVTFGPVFSILVELMKAHLEGRVEYLSSLSVEIGLPVATTWRKLKGLHSQGLVSIERDERDRRRVRVILTDKGIGRMSAFIECMRVSARTLST